MFGIGGTEFLVILIVGILVLGPDHLPRLVRTFAKVMSEFRKISTDFQRAVHFEADEAERAQKEPPQKKKKPKKQPPSPPAPDENPAAAAAPSTPEPEPEAAPPAIAPEGPTEPHCAATGSDKKSAPRGSDAGGALPEDKR
ncbi:MAG: twin-arginine translocase TatA/TatE family subunit [Desulfovibrio sp.]|jgi:sec-independent protein translocase protein TatB|nr:twin-arginine translocase TatA/TatE family subunit [Desulfovibrio sp.]